MVRPLRIEFAGALYHITSRGNERQDIYRDDTDRQQFLSILGDCIQKYNWHCHAFCLMSNHYHLLIETAAPTLSKGMRQLNGVYTQFHNIRHKRVGHLFQGRYKAILVEKEYYLLELSRYIVLNPVRAGMVSLPEQWPWSSFQASSGAAPSPEWLTLDYLLASFSCHRKEAIYRYRSFVLAGIDKEAPWNQLKNQIYLGSDQFVEETQCRLQPDQPLRDVPRVQKQAPRRELDWYSTHYTDPKQAMVRAYLSGHYSLEEVGNHFGVSRMTVSRAVKAHVKCET